MSWYHDTDDTIPNKFQPHTDWRDPDAPITIAPETHWECEGVLHPPTPEKPHGYLIDFDPPLVGESHADVYSQVLERLGSLAYRCNTRDTIREVA